MKKLELEDITAWSGVACLISFSVLVVCLCGRIIWLLFA